MEYTANYNFKKPSYEDGADIQALNDNFDTADAALAAKSSKSITAPVTLTAAGWVEDTENGWWTQAVSNPAIVDGRKVDISFDAAQIRQLAEDGASIMVVNDDGTATAYAFGAAPTVDLAGYIEIREVTA